MKLTDEIIKERLNQSLIKLYTRDYSLLENSAHERSVTHKLAVYLNELFPDYDVDCEYNLNIDDRNDRKRWITQTLLKELKRRKSNALVSEDSNLDEEIEKMSTNFYPDIIVHKRRSNKQNLLIIEAKKNNDTELDIQKLIEFTKTGSSINQFNYQLGALIIFDVGEKYDGNNFTEPIFFKNGRELKDICTTRQQGV